MNKKTFTPAIIFLALAVVAIIFVAKSETGTRTNNEAVKSDIILFYGESCPYCLVVDKFVEDNKVEEKISFEHREVYSNQANAALMTTKARICGLNTNSIGVPFLWDGSNCLIGDRDIIAFFEAELAILENLEPQNGIEIESFEATTSEVTSSETENLEVETENFEAETLEVEAEVLNENQ